MTEETNQEVKVEIEKEPETTNLKEMTRPELLKVLAKWRNRIKIEEIAPEKVHLEAYLVLVIDEAFHRLNDMAERLSKLEAGPDDK